MPTASAIRASGEAPRPGCSQVHGAGRIDSEAERRTRGSLGFAISPVESLRKRARFSRYSSPLVRQEATSGTGPTARSYSRSPSSTHSSYERERVLFVASQFQPPSSSCSPTKRRIRVSLGRRKYAPDASAPPLIHGSSSPSKKVFPPVSGARRSQQPPEIIPPQPGFQTRYGRRNRGIVGVDADGSQHHRKEGRKPRGSIAAAPRAIRLLQVENLRGDPLVRDAARLEAISAAEALVRSRIACQLRAGSEPSSHSMVSTT